MHASYKDQSKSEEKLIFTYFLYQFDTFKIVILLFIQISNYTSYEMHKLLKICYIKQ